MRRRKNLVVSAIAMAMFSIAGDSHSKDVPKENGLADLVEKMEKKYAAFGKTADEILSHDDPEVFDALCWHLGRKATAKGKSSLTPTELKLLAVCDLDGEVNNGGFDQYFSNSAGDDAADALVVLKDMGAVKTAALLAKAMAVFPSSKPPADRFKRQEVMEKIQDRSEAVWDKCDDAYYKLGENLRPLSLACARKHKAEIVLP